MDDSNDLFAKLERIIPNPPHAVGELSHYTDLHAFISIIQTGQLWASNIRFLNDKAEMTFGIETAKELFREVFTKRLDARTRKKFNRFDPIAGSVIPDVYACCFCEQADMLSQWRGYGLQRQSVSIQFEFDDLAFLTRGLEHDIWKVIYGKKEAKRRLQDHLGSYSFTEWEDLLDDQTRVDFNKRRAELIFSEAPRFKDIGFQEEQEWRIIMKNAKAQKPLYRVRDNVLMPYVTVEDGSGKLPINSVTIGPGKDMALTEKSVRHFLDEHEYTDVRVDTSDIPYRT